MATASDKVEIFTIGHSNLPTEEVIAALRANGIELVVDVRSVPFSQYTRHFNRDELERTLAAAGIGYAFAGEHLGGRPTDPTCYRTGELPEDGASYLDLVDYEEVAKRSWYRCGLARLVDVARARRTAILCSEEHPRRCHRHHLIARSLLELNVEVWHIRRHGTLEPATREARQMTLLP